jgi:ubiquinone/menaquinone biosynthesis C-methylase UbiE
VPLYDWVAPAYDPLLGPIYRKFRARALELMPPKAGATILDLACGTGQNFPLLAAKVGLHGKIIGLDLSPGMLRGAARTVKRRHLETVSLMQLDACALSSATLKAQTGTGMVDFVVCTYGFTSMGERDWETAFHRAYGVLKPGGGFLVHDIYAEKRTLRVRAVEKVTRSTFTRKTWLPLERQSIHFHMEYFDPTPKIFGGQLFAAYGTKH